MAVRDFSLAGLERQGIDDATKNDGEQRYQGSKGKGYLAAVQLGEYAEGRHVRGWPGQQKCQGSSWRHTFQNQYGNQRRGTGSADVDGHT